jgi:hypothetical protein
MDYTFFANLHQEFTLPEKGILSRVLHKDEKVNVTLFGFARARNSQHIRPQRLRFSISWRAKPNYS